MKLTRKIGKRERLILLSTVIIISLFIYLHTPRDLFHDPTSTILVDSSGDLLAARIAADGQWRFPHSSEVPDKFKAAIINFEDRYFYYHSGINPISIVRAAWQNIKAKRVVSGGSTITAQVIRISRKNRPRTIFQKLIEYTLALKAELCYNKDEILAFYNSNAPFGGNVVGLEAASWRYYNRPADQLSWGESAMLAVLPNAPSLIYPGKNHEILKRKRDRLLDKLYHNGVIDKESCELAKLEPLPEKPHPLPRYTPHLLSRVIKEGQEGEKIVTTIDKALQSSALRVIDKHYKHLSQSGIINAASLIIEIETGKVISYIGNTDHTEKDSGKDVDIVTAERSSGSTLKPILYALMQQSGTILPNTLIPDIPTHIADYTPKNFDKSYRGAAPAGKALAKSLNIPAVRMLKNYGIERFHSDLNRVGFTTFTKPANHYGLSIILGGGETTLWDLATVYSNMARSLNNFGSDTLSQDYHHLYFDNSSKDDTTYPSTINASSAWLTFEALTDMERPVEGEGWRYFSSSKKIAWKTGTSFGHRDAWAIGVTSKYVVAVWTGNADGEGRAGLTGTRSAAPIMFNLFDLLPNSKWFTQPLDNLFIASTCKRSGYKAGPHCEECDTILISEAGLNSELCPFHKQIYLDSSESYVVDSDCYPISKMVKRNWFILPPTMEYYFKKVDPFYRSIPPFYPNSKLSDLNSLEIIYPKDGAVLFIPNGFNRDRQSIIFEATNRDSNAKVHWSIDGNYIGTTSGQHKMEIDCSAGKHLLTLVDGSGYSITSRFKMVEK